MVVRVWAQLDLPAELRVFVSNGCLFISDHVADWWSEKCALWDKVCFSFVFLLLVRSRCTLLCGLQLVISSSVTQRLKSKGTYPIIYTRHTSHMGIKEQEVWELLLKLMFRGVCIYSDFSCWFFFFPLMTLIAHCLRLGLPSFAAFLVWILWLIQVRTSAAGKSKCWMGILLMGGGSFQISLLELFGHFWNWRLTWCRERVRKNREESCAWVAPACFVIKLFLLSAQICVVLTSRAVTEEGTWSWVANPVVLVHSQVKVMTKYVSSR